MFPDFVDKYRLFNSDSEKYELFKNNTLSTLTEKLSTFFVNNYRFKSDFIQKYFRRIGKNLYQYKKEFYDGCKSSEYNFSRSRIFSILKDEKEEKKYVFYLQTLFDLKVFPLEIEDKLVEQFKNDIIESKYPLKIIYKNDKYNFEYLELQKYSPYKIALKPSQSLSDDFFNHVVNNIFYYYRNVEQYPSIYTEKDEEALRDLIIPFLNQNYVDTVTTSETFNKKGKTDILIKDTNGVNLFIGECKIWKGKQEFHNGMNQLVERYTNWRDSKIALLIFNTKNKDFSNVIKEVKNATLNSNYINEISEVYEDGTRISCLVKPKKEDPKKISCEILVFNFRL